MSEQHIQGAPPGPERGPEGLSPIEQLEQLRAQIDEVDAELMEQFGVIAEQLTHRFELTHQVGVLKAQHDLPPVDESREAEQKARFNAWTAEHDLPPMLLEDIWSVIIGAVVVNHQKLRGDHNE